MAEPSPQPPVDATAGIARRHRVPALAAVAGGNIAVLLLGLISSTVAARVLGPNLRGEFVGTQTWAVTAGDMLALGVTQAVVTYRGRDEDLTGPLALQTLVAVPAGLGLFFLLSASGAQSWLTPPGVVGGATLAVGGLVISLCGGLVQRQGRMVGAFQRVRVLPQVATVIVLLVLWWSGNRDPNTWLCALGITLVVTAAVLFQGLIGGSRSLLKTRLKLPPRPLVRDARNALVVVIGVAVVYRLDSLVVAVYLHPAQVALYAVATTATAVCNGVGQSVGMVAFSRLRYVDSAAARRALIRQGTIRALAVTTAVAVPLTLLAPVAIRVVYGPAFVPATGTTRMLVLASIPLSVDFLLLLALLSMSAGRSAFRVQALDAVLTIGLLAVAVPTHNLVAIAVVSLGVYSISAVLLYISAMRWTRTEIDGSAARS